MNENDWQRVTFSAIFFRIGEEPTTKHPKENSLNLKEDIWRGTIELRVETIPYGEMLTVRRRNDSDSCSQIFFQTSVSEFSHKNTCVGVPFS